METITRIELADKFNASSKKQQEVLKEVFGNDFFNVKIQDRIKSFGDACDFLGVENIIPDVDGLESKHKKAVIAHYKLAIIAQALNEEWEPDWSESSEKKWWPWFRLSSGFGFGSSYYGYDYSYSDVGSRLCFKSRELSDYAAKQFIDLYRDLMLF